MCEFLKQWLKENHSSLYFEQIILFASKCYGEEITAIKLLFFLLSNWRAEASNYIPAKESYGRILITQQFSLNKLKISLNILQITHFINQQTRQL